MNTPTKKSTEIHDPQRRRVLKGTAIASFLGVTGIIELLSMPEARAEWPKAAFDADKLEDAIGALFEGEAADSADITLKIPDIAENGAVVPVSVKTGMENVKRIAIFVPENPAPMVASFEMSPEVVADVSTRIKMGKTSPVIAMVEAADGVYMTSKEVKVTIGGCGG